MRIAARRICAVAIGVLAGHAAAAAAAVPGPPLQEPPRALADALTCTGTLGGAKKTPVLLAHGTFGSAGQWTGNYAKALPEQGHPICAVSDPKQQTGDVQRAVEYVVHAIRWMNARSRRPVAVIGYSQGALLATYALRFWPDLADGVTDVVGIAGVYEGGTLTAGSLCAFDACPIAGRQILPGSRFLTALARRPVYRGPDYTTVATYLDWGVFPQPRAGSLPGARAYFVQDLCPGRPTDHAAMAIDAVPYALALDAIAHDGPADSTRVGSVPCAQTTLPGFEPAGFVQEAAKVGPAAARGAQEGRGLPEPALRCHLDQACPKPRLRPGLTLATTRTRSRLRVTGAVELPAGALDRCSGTVSVTASLRGRRLRSLTAPVAADCRFDAALRVALPKARRVRPLRMTARFSGSKELLPRRARQVVRT